VYIPISYETKRMLHWSHKPMFECLEMSKNIDII